MKKIDIQSIRNKLKNIHIIVVGDVMIDRYFYGTVSRISPEAPVPVLDWIKTIDRPGGAANVALNIRELECKVSLISVVGDNEDGHNLKKMLEAKGIDCYFYHETDRHTTIKSRFMSDNNQLLRLDTEHTYPVNTSAQDYILNSLTNLENMLPSAIILQDYNKGIFQKENIQQIISIANNQKIPICVDPKKDNFFEYQNVALFKPNLKEAKSAIPNCKSNEDLFISLFDKVKTKYLMLTTGSDGMILGTKTNYTKYNTIARMVKDVSGAGDSVISMASICIALNLDINSIAELSNLAGGLVCEKPGVSTITWREVEMAQNF